MVNDSGESREAVGRLLSAAEAVWARHREAGPGRTDAALYDAVTAAADELQPGSLPAEAAAAVETLRDLSHRCCCRPEGLCFIAGESGLIPRKDLHALFEQSLAVLRRFA